MRYFICALRWGGEFQRGPLAEKTWILMGKLINNSVLGDMEINEIGKCFGKGRFVLK